LPSAPASGATIYMYYGNAGASPQYNNASTWNSGYGGVWHMNEIDSVDSSGNGNTGDTNWNSCCCRWYCW